MARITKTAKLCYLLSLSGPTHRVDVMRRLHVLEGKTHRFMPHTNHDYFIPRRRYDGWHSPVALGLIVRVKRDRRGIVYGLSELGQVQAQMYRDHMEG